MSKLTDPAWWKAALLRAVYTAIAIAIPYIAAVQFADVPWLMAASAATVGAILSFATSLFGLPESEGVDLPWWLAALERVVKTFGQSLAAGLTGAVLLSDVDWSVVLQAALGAAFISLLRLILATLPADPTPAAAVTLGQTVNGTWADAWKEDPALGTRAREPQRRTFP
ncbi:holin [Microbacterium sp.]|uniref:holin n=1 Tax=Microbacterium sp. TaxID=51671 RepID=UPI0028ABBDF8|nr:holin [Microbacterium sp.]